MKQKGTATTPKKPNAFWAWFVSFLNFFRDNKVLFIIIGLFVWFFFPQLKLWFKFKGVERVQIAKLLKPLEKRLDNLAEKAKTVEDLSDEEAGEMQSLKKAIVAAKKKVKEGPPPPPVPPPPNQKKKFGIGLLSGKPRRNNWLLAGKKLSVGLMTQK